MSTHLARFIELDQNSTVSLNDEGLIGLADGLEPARIIQIVSDYRIRHIVQKQGFAVEAEKRCAVQMIENPSAFMAAPLETILGSQVDRSAHFPLSINVAIGAPKSEVLSEVEDFLRGLKGAQIIRDDAILIADELFTNAVKHGRQTAGEKSSKEENGESSIKLFALSDGARLILGCIDSFGQLDLTKVLERIRLCYSQGVAKSIRQGDGGAGIGSFMVFNSAIGYYVGVECGRRTVVCAALPLGISHRASEEIPKNIHLVSVA